MNLKTTFKHLLYEYLLFSDKSYIQLVINFQVSFTNSSNNLTTR